MTAGAIDGFAPLRDEEWPGSILPLRSGFAGSLAVYRVMARHPDLLAAWASLREHVVRSTALGPLRAEVVILRVARHWRCDYERAHHVVRARKVGMETDRIDALSGPIAGVHAEDRELAYAVDDLLAQGRIDAEVAVRLARDLGKQAILDLLATIGMYTTLALAANTLGVPIDAGEV